jgi:DNA-binding transcriptional MerR regulator
MEQFSKTPSYNLKVVIQETGLKADTLRAWERRYGLPDPKRTTGGHRLYSQYDIEMIKWLMERQAEGLRINRAVGMWRNFESSGQDPFQELPVREQPKQLAAGWVIEGKVIEEVKQEWVQACLAFDETRAESILAQAFARFPIETVCLEVLTEGIADIGGKWYAGESSVQQEHFASALAVRRLNALLAGAPPPNRKGRILSACPPGDDHIYPLLLTTLFLRLRGWDVVYLGANVPIDKLDTAIQMAKTDLVVSSAQQLITASSLYQVAVFLQEKHVPMAFGGLIFTLLPELVERIPGRYLGDSLEMGVKSIEQLMQNPSDLRKGAAVSDQYIEAADHFEDMQPVIAAYMWSQFQRNGMKDQHLEVANRFLGQDIQAGLRLGDLGLLKNEMVWLEGLLKTNHIPIEYVPKYLALYKQAVDENLDDRGQPVKDWLDQELTKNFSEGAK